MHTKILRLVLCAAFGVLTHSAFASDTTAVLNRAAQLHKNGETAAAIAIWRNLAVAGDEDAAYNLGLVHYYADGVGRDYGEAMKWYRLAAERGDKPSQFQIGLMYLNGEGVPADPAAAHQWFTKHLREHAHHEHSPQMVAWRRQALALLEERDNREALRLSRQESNRIMADLQRRAASSPVHNDVAPAMTALVTSGGAPH